MYDVIIYSNQIINLNNCLIKISSSGIVYFSITNRFGLNGRICIMRLVCELAESHGLPYNGILGKALEALFL